MQTGKRIAFTMLLFVCLGTAGLSVVRLIQIYSARFQTQSVYSGLQNQVQEPPQESTPTAEQELPTESPYLPLLDTNPHLIGWISIPGTDIDYPVLQHPEISDYYLSHDFNGKKDAHGVPYVDSSWDMDDWDNLVIYGHHMRDGTMFAQLDRFTNDKFREANPEIWFDTLTSSSHWRVVAVFRIRAADTAVFPYHEVRKFSPETMTAEDYLTRAKYYSLWAADALTRPDARLITLSTCEYTLGDGRLVVIFEEVE